MTSSDIRIKCNPNEITDNNYVPELDKRRVLPNPQAQHDIGLCDFRLDEFKPDVKSKTVNELLENPENLESLLFLSRCSDTLIFLIIIIVFG